MEWNRLVAVVGICAVSSCGGDELGLGIAPGVPDEGTGVADIGVGDIDDAATKDDSTWGYALECKTWPSLAELPNPEIIISLKGLTLHLIDRSTGFSRVYPVGVGQIQSSGNSLSSYPVRATGRNTFSIVNIETCKTWWTDPANGKRSPVFAGMPFIRFYNGFGIHGPIDNFKAQNGGTLRRGYVSHGCIRMESADVLEVAALIGGRDGRAKATIKILRENETERDAAGLAIDVPQKWIGSECKTNVDCNFAGGVCQTTSAGHGVCSAPCERVCNYDKYGYSPTYCVADPTTGAGMCASRPSGFNNWCKRFDGTKSTTLKRHRTTTNVSVCYPK
ncbi:MAG: L,D-transpeptidase [Deltaproteobacteria bacterium]|nr:L,D-transpeptidase [Deltaproteobacteria bacterium]